MRDTPKITAFADYYEIQKELHDEKLNIEGVVDELRTVKAECDRLKAELEMMRTWASKTHDEMGHQAKLALDARGERDAAQAALEINALALTGERDQWEAVAEQLAFAGSTVYGHQQTISSEETRWGLAGYEHWREAFAAYARLKGEK